MSKMRLKLAIAGRLYGEIQEAADAAVHKWNKMSEEAGLKSERLQPGTVQDIDEHGVEIDWYETWSYGGYDEGKYTLTLNELDPETQDEVFKKRIADLKAAEKKRATAEKRATVRQEKAMLKKLQEKYA